jgi:hypothetical protein
VPSLFAAHDRAMMVENFLTVEKNGRLGVAPMIYRSYDFLAVVGFCQHSPCLSGGTVVCQVHGSLAQHRIATYIRACGPDLGEEVLVPVAVEDQSAIL